MTKDQFKSLRAKIDSEGFDYYFINYCDPESILEEYGDQELYDLVNKYVDAHDNLHAYLQSVGKKFDLDLYL